MCLIPSDPISSSKRWSVISCFWFSGWKKGSVPFEQTLEKASEAVNCRVMANCPFVCYELRSAIVSERANIAPRPSWAMQLPLLPWVFAARSAGNILH